MSDPPVPEKPGPELRTEWLRARGQLVDPGTTLPTLAAVLDDVGRLLAAKPLLGLIYFELAAEDETHHGWQSYDACVRAFAEALLKLRIDAVLPAETPIATLGVRSEAFAVFAGSGVVTFDRDSIATLSAELVGHIARVLEDRTPTPGTPRPGFHYGYALLRRDPMLRPERSVQRALDEAAQMALLQQAREEDALGEQLQSIIAGEHLQTLWQPVVRLDDESPIGREAFSRGPSATELESPLRLFALAERRGRLVELERLCLERALRLVGGRLAGGEKLFLNTSSTTLREHLVGSEFAELVDSSGLRRGDVVIDVPERLTQGNRAAAAAAVAAVKQAGFAVAIDDMGGGNSSLQSLVEFAPDFLKFDVSLVREIDRSLIKRGLLETLLDFSVKIGARVVAEGVESDSELEALRQMGVELGQGHRFGRPVPASSEDSSS